MKNIYYPSCDQLRSRFLHLLIKGLLLLIFGLMISRQQARAQDDLLLNETHITGTGMDKYGMYVEFMLPYGHNAESSGVYEANVYVEYDYKGPMPIIKYGIAPPYNSWQYVSCSFYNYGLPDHIGMSYRSYDDEENGKPFLFWPLPGIGLTLFDPGAESSIMVRWYVPQELLGKELSFRAAGDMSGDNEGSFNKDLGKRTLTNPIPEAAFQVEPSGNIDHMSVNYSFNSDFRYDVTYKILDNTIHETDKTHPSGSVDVDRRNIPYDYVFKITAKTLPLSTITYTRSQLVRVPAYIWPDKLNADYNEENSVTLSWSVDAAAGKSGTDFIDGDEFEVGRSTDPSFSDASKIHIFASPQYDPEKEHYTVTDDLKDLEGSAHVYYRLRRSASKDKWKWDVFRDADVNIDMNTTQIADTVILAQTKEGPQDTIKWQPFRGVWTDGTEFQIEKINKTTPTLHQTFKLTEKEARSGQYIDKNIAYCNEYRYALNITLGGGFSSPGEVPVPGSILAVNIGDISNLQVSKGYFPDRTQLQWHSQGQFDNFIIKRRIYGSSDSFVQVGTVEGSSTTDIKATDPKGAPGVYYEYRVVGAVRCNNEIRYSNVLHGVGFRAPTGKLYGRITYENGQAVKGATVRLENINGDQLGKSLYLNGMENSYLKIDSLHTPLQDAYLTVSAWIKPDGSTPKNAVIFRWGKQPASGYELGFDANNKLYFSYNGQKVSCDYQNEKHSFIHISGIHDEDTLKLMINDAIMAVHKIVYHPVTDPPNKLTIGGDATGRVFKGYIDEMRIWNKALSDSLVARNYKRLLTGGEPGLVAYWRFNETIKDAFYDLSYQGDTYHRNDGYMDSTVVTHSAVIPSDDQLGIKAYTDSTGNYIITGIPYKGVNGTTYKIFPQYNAHKFDPITVTRLYAAGSANYTVNFTDISSYKVSGKVLYSHTTIPVEGASFKIDGLMAQDGKGNIFKTDATGYFEIMVPVGIHEVKAVKANHVFEADGRIRGVHGEDLNYQGPVSPVKIYDSTTVRVVGRVAGGIIQKSFPLGHSLSTNNLGRELSIKLVLPSGPKYNLCEADKTVYIDHYVSPYGDSSDLHKTKITYSYDNHDIIIFPDPETGEFVADLLPIQYIAEDVHATGWGNLLIDDKGNLNKVTLSLSNKFVDQTSVYNYKDSTRTSDFTWQFFSRSDTVHYNDDYQFIKRVKPQLSILQDANGTALPFFGDSIYVLNTLDGRVDSIPAIDRTKSGKAMYLMEHPIFTKAKSYQFEIHSSEQYPFYESEDAQGKVIREVNGKPVIDYVPSQDGLVTFYNYLQAGATGAETLALDSTGTGTYSFTAGDPDFSANGLQDFSASLKVGAATNLNWSWNGEPVMRSFIMGGKQTGTDFVTSGPDKLLMILRDPPGNRSYTYAEKGSVSSTVNTYTTTIDTSADINETLHLGGKVVTWTGVGAGVITTQEVIGDIGGGFHYERHKMSGHTFSNTFTTTQRFQTSDKTTFVGAPADLFVGYSTNLIFGTTNNLVIIKDQPMANDKIKYALPDSSFLVVQREGIGIGEHFKTLFAYPQQHIVKVLIPRLTHLRNSLLWLPDSASSVDPQQAANNLGRAIYVSKLGKDNKNFGKSNIDSIAFPHEAASLDSFWTGPSYTIYYPDSSLLQPDSILSIDSIQNLDSVMLMNQYIAAWEARLSNNEKAKLNMDLLQNYSFQAGSPVSYEEQSSQNLTWLNSFKTVVAGSLTFKLGLTVLKIGTETSTYQEWGKETDNESQTGTTTHSTVGFQLASDGTDEYLSVDVGKSKEDDGFVFTTKGGATGCPYEGELRTQYYQKGKLINQPTLRIEVPKISVEGNAVVNNVPATRTASYTLLLKNESEAKLPATFILTYANTDSIKGAYIAVDGSTIAGGRSFSVQPGETVEKVLTLKKGPVAMDYDNIPIILHSACQYDPTGYQTLIADTVLISAHFVPSCSDIHLAQPVDQWILNTSAPLIDSNTSRPYLPVVLNDFDASDQLFDHIELQYKPSASSQWTTTMKFYADPDKYAEADGDRQMITNAQQINYKLEMKDGQFNDQPYDIRSLTVCKLGPGNNVKTYSNTVSGIRDRYRPRQFGTPQPANGILGIGNDIRLTFNEPIAAGLLTDNDIHLEGILNGSPNDHSVSVHFNGVNDEAASEFDKNLTGKNTTVSMWVLPDKLQNATLFSQGDKNESMELGLTVDKHLEITFGQQVYLSDEPINYEPEVWAHAALVYNASDSTLSAFYNGKEVLHPVTVDKYRRIGPVILGRSMQKEGGNYYAGKMHDVQVWTKVLSPATIKEKSEEKLSGSENGLLAYYPMAEGTGDVVQDKANGNNLFLKGTWNTPPGKAIAFNGNGYIKMKTGSIPITDEMNYTIGLWFKAGSSQSNKTLVSNGKGDGSDPGDTQDLFSLGFEDGLITFNNKGTKIQATGNYLDNQWHHVAIAVNKTTDILQIFVDGALKKYTTAEGLGGIISGFTYLGCRVWYDRQDAITPHTDRYFTGEIDDYRLWNTYLDHSYLENNYNSRLNGDEMGLLAYYPFEKYAVSESNVTQMDSTLKDMKTPDALGRGSYAVAENVIFSDEMAPLKDQGPVVPLNISYVVNNDALIINLEEKPVRIDNTLINIHVGRVFDKHGNTLASPITWTAYVDQNPLNWSDEELNLSKEVNKPMQFESYIINSGGKEENYHLDNLPPWLEATPVSGTVPPEGKQKITFTINEGLNVGSYDNIIEMTNNLQETRGLALTLKVNGETPAWKVNPADFRYNMTVYGKIRIKGIFSSDPEDMLAAFRDGKCIGVVHNTYFRNNDLWYAFLTLYSNDLQFDESELTFRIWDASTGKVYTGVPSATFAFKNGSIEGTPREPVVYDGVDFIFEHIPLQKGWNWLSFNVKNPSSQEVNTVLANGDWYSGDVIKLNNEGFANYSQNDRRWVTGHLTTFDNRFSYMLKTHNAQTLNTGGTPVDVTTTAIPVKGGVWNYISYLPQRNMTLKEALSDYKASSEDVIKSQTGFAMYDTQMGWVGNLTYLEPGKGYMLYSNASAKDSFYYPKLPGVLRHYDPQRSDMMARYPGLDFSRLNYMELPVKNNFAFPANMTVIASVGKGVSLQPQDKIVAYIGDKVAGRALGLQDPLTHTSAFFFNLSGSLSQSVCFKLEREGKEIAETPPVLSYRSNSMVGSLKAPLILHFGKSYFGVRLSPNPFSKQLSLEVRTDPKQEHTLTIKIYSTSGQLVYRQSRIKITNGYYQSYWSGKTNSGTACTPGVYFVHLTVDGHSHIYKVIRL